MRNIRNLSCLFLMLATIPACSDLNESLGLGRSSPDEFAVLERPSLAMPPDYNLRPPQPGAPPRQDVRAPATAQEILAGKKLDVAASTPASTPAPQTVSALDKDKPSAAEQDLLKSSKAASKEDGTPSDIRAVVDAEADTPKRERTFFDWLMFWRDPPSDAVTVDVADENARMKEMKDKPAPEAQPTIP